MITIRTATRADVPLILELIRELATYERAPHEAVATRDDLLRDGFSEQPKFRVAIAEWEGTAAGFALFFNNYSTWRGRPGIYLEDLFVRPQFRRRGVGRALLSHLAQIAVNEGCTRLEWAVLDWNTPALDFYRSLGATPLDEWTTLRVTGSALSRMAQIG